MYFGLSVNTGGSLARRRLEKMCSTLKKKRSFSQRFVVLDELADLLSGKNEF